MGKAFSAEICPDTGSSQHLYSIHLFTSPVSLPSELFCSCKTNPLARNSLQKKNPHNFQLEFSRIANRTPLHSGVRLQPASPAHRSRSRLCPQPQPSGGAGANASAGCRRPHGNHTYRSHGNALQRAG